MFSRYTDNMRKTYFWERMPDDEILDMRLCDLKLILKGSRVERLLDKLYRELQAKKLRFRPHFWISDEWYKFRHLASAKEWRTYLKAYILQPVKDGKARNKKFMDFLCARL